MLSNSLKDNLHIWNIDITESLYKEAINQIDILSDEEKSKFYSFRFSEDKARHMVSHVALRRIINYYTNLPLSQIKYKHNRYNKAYLSNNISFPLFFNLSHANKKAIIAINNTEVGVDIEYIKNSLDIYELAEVIFSNFEYQEFQLIKNHNKKLSYFYNIWTKKEAYLKAIAVGLVDNLREINVGSKPQSKIDDKFVSQNINPYDNDYMANIVFEGIKYRNIVYFEYLK